MLAGLVTRYPSASPLACKLVWGVCRNLSVILGPQAAPKRTLADTGSATAAEDRTAAALVTACAGVAAKFDAAQLCGVLAAVMAGATTAGRSFPPISPSTASGRAVASFLTAVLTKAADRGLSASAQPGKNVNAKTLALWKCA